VKLVGIGILKNRFDPRRHFAFLLTFLPPPVLGPDAGYSVLKPSFTARTDFTG
jgi:hypothetical protein